MPSASTSAPPPAPHGLPSAASASQVPVRRLSSDRGTEIRMPATPSMYTTEITRPESRITRGTSRCGSRISSPAELISSKPRAL